MSTASTSTNGTNVTATLNTMFTTVTNAGVEAIASIFGFLFLGLVLAALITIFGKDIKKLIRNLMGITEGL